MGGSLGSQSEQAPRVFAQTELGGDEVTTALGHVHVENYEIDFLALGRESFFQRRLQIACDFDLGSCFAEPGDTLFFIGLLDNQ